jgi:putative ABC transport system ATP-binding protein
MPSPRPTEAPLLQLTALAKAVPSGRVLFSGLDLTVRAGELLAVTGESGVGKSTLLNLIAGLDVADGGEVRLDGQALGALDDDARTRLRRDRIGFVFQAFHILPHLTLAQNVALPLALQHVRAPDALARAGEVLAAVGLAGRDRDAPRQLSGGELQRVAIARALAHRPALILADEPTGNLDPETAGRILDLFTRQVREAGAAAILVTHSDQVAGAADRALTLTPHGLITRHG